MSYTQAQLDALREAFASGVTRVSYEGKTVEYRSLSEIQAAIRAVEAGLSSTPRTTHINPVFERDG